MIKLALLGRDLSYSKSRQMHTFIAKHLGIDIVYDYVETNSDGLKSAVKNLLENYHGFNITIPYKQSVIDFLQNLSGDANAVRSVNTVLCADKSGYNTDGDGFMLMLESEKVDVFGKTILVLGAGGAATSCVYKLTKKGTKVFVYNRTFKKVQDLYNLYGGFTPLESLSGKYDIIVNTTSVGMTSLEGQLPIDKSYIEQADTLVDLIYNPTLTQFLKVGQNLGKRIVNGEKMLFFQAYFAQSLYFSFRPDKAQAEKIFNKYKKEGGK